MSSALIWHKQKLSRSPWQVSKKIVTVFFQHFVFRCNCLFAFFIWVYTICSLIWDLKQFAIASWLWRSALRNETNELSQTVSMKATGICRHCKWKEHSGLSSGPSPRGLAVPEYSLAWAFFLKSECFLNVRLSLLTIWTRKYQHRRLMFSKVEV